MLSLAHGTYKIELSNNILTVSGKGPWNLEATTCFASEIKRKIMSCEDKIHGMVAILDGESIAPREALAEVQKVVEWRIERNLDFPSAFVFVQKEGRALFESIFESIYKNIAVPFGVFDSAKEAYRWINAMQMQRCMMSSDIAM